MTEFGVFDTSIFIDVLRAGRHVQKMAALRLPVRISSVVLAELWRGALNASDRKLVKELEEDYPLLTPTTRNWMESGQILAKIRVDHGFEQHKLRELHFDVLIALTARSHGARLITSNRGDFEMIRDYRNFKLEVW
jgi:predicted nucleic acid-binding protein